MNQEIQTMIEALNDCGLKLEAKTEILKKEKI